MKLPEWANWLARDEGGRLYAYDVSPHGKSDGIWVMKSDSTWQRVEETDSTFSHIEWTDNEPTKIKRGLEAGGVSVTELNRIMNAKAHGYYEVPELADKTERVHVENDMINQPLHYVGNQGLEVEVVLQNFIPRYEDPYVGHRIASAIEYLLRSPLKNQRQDIEKAGKNIQQALAYLDMMEEEE